MSGKRKEDNRDIFEKVMDEVAPIAMAAPALYLAGRSIRRGAKKIRQGEPPGVPVSAIGGLTAGSVIIGKTRADIRKKNRK